MQWYDSLRVASKPPAYMVERISDLLHASDLARTAPSDARSLIDLTVSKLVEHMDDEYVDDLTAISGIILDNPTKARDMLDLVVGIMRNDKRRLEREKQRHPWQMI